MSYKWGMNGNDLNWEAIEFLKIHCASCLEYYKDKVCKYDCEDSAEYIDFICAGCGDECNCTSPYIHDGKNYCEECVYAEQYCEGHTLYYTNINKERFLELHHGAKLKEGEWLIWQDTNSNFAGFIGEVPDEYLTEDYIEERDKALKE